MKPNRSSTNTAKANPNSQIVVPTPDIIRIVASGAEEVIRIAPDGKLFWRGREVETDADFRAAMLELADRLVEKTRHDIGEALRECAKAQDEDGGRFDTRPTSELLREAAEALEQRSGPNSSGWPPAGSVLVAIHRPEGYDDVHPDLLLHDALRDGFDYTLPYATDRDGGTNGR